MKPIRLVLVDDSPVFLASAGEMLGQCASLDFAGTASSGAEAIALVDRAGPDLVLLDVNMPGMNGLEAARRIKAKNARIRVIMISVNKGKDLERAALAAGADAFAAKDDLAGALSRHAQAWFGFDPLATRSATENPEEVSR